MPPKPKSTTAVFVPKVQSQMRVFSIAQRLLSTLELRPLLPVPEGATISSLITSPRRLRTCGLPNKKLRRPIPHALVPPSRLSSEPSHDSINLHTRRAGSEATMCCSARRNQRQSVTRKPAQSRGSSSYWSKLSRRTPTRASSPCTQYRALWFPRHLHVAKVKLHSVHD
jgi:hypothetical protein